MRRSPLVALTLCCFLVPMREAHAGDVLAVGKGGKLALTGGDSNDELVVDQPAPGVLRVTPGNATTVNGEVLPVQFPMSGGLTVDLGGGDDVLGFETALLPENLKVKLGAGFDRVTMRGTQVTGAVTMDLGAGAAAVALCQGTIGKGLKVKAGLAGPGQAHAICDGIANADVVVTDGVAVVLGNELVGAGLAMATKGGPAKVLTSDSNVTGKATLAFGEGTALAAICDTSVSRNVTITLKGGTANGAIACEVGAASASIDADGGAIFVGSTVGGSLVVKGGKGDDAIATDSVVVDGSMKVLLAEGTNLLALGGTIGESLLVKGGKSLDLVTAGALVVGESAKLALGAGSNTVFFDTAAIGENLTITTGDGDDFIDTDSTVVGGTLKIKNGAGNDTVTR